MWFANIEMRTRLTEFQVWGQSFAVGMAPFVDVGTVRDRWQNLFDMATMKVSVGAGLRIAWNQSTILSLDYGVSREDKLLYFGIGQIF
jgi:outer membrane translocation and assembly module TamA